MLRMVAAAIMIGWRWFVQRMGRKRAQTGGGGRPHVIRGGGTAAGEASRTTCADARSQSSPTLVMQTPQSSQWLERESAMCE